MINEEHYLISNWFFFRHYTSVERGGKEEQGGVVWGVSKDLLVKLAVLLWTPAGSGVPACFWE